MLSAFVSSPAYLGWMWEDLGQICLVRFPSPPYPVLCKSSLRNYFIDLWDLSLKMISTHLTFPVPGSCDLRIINK